MTASQAATATARTAAAVSAAMRITSTAVWTIWATMGPILATMRAAPRMMATAAMPAPWPRELSQHDGLHITGRRGVGSVDHATHLFLDGFREGCFVAGRAGGWLPSRPGTGFLVRARFRAGRFGGVRRRRCRA